MRCRASWAVAAVLLLARIAHAQAPEQVPFPTAPPINFDKPAEGAPALPLQAIRPGQTFYADADFLYWWVNHAPAPSLVTTAPNNGLNANGLTGGILGQPGTQVLLSGDDLRYSGFAAGRITAGVNLGDGFWSFEASGFILPRQSIDFNFTGSANGTPLLTIPFLDAATGQQSALAVSAQNATGGPLLTGSIAVHSDLQVWGAEFDFVAHSIHTAERTVDLLFGFRTLSLNENLGISQTIVPSQEGAVTLQSPSAGLGAGNYFFAAPGSPVYVNDSFATRNQFYGPQTGARFRWDLANNLTADLAVKVAVGVTHEEAAIDGSSTATLAINPNTGALTPNLTTQGGTFALKNNIGNYSQDQFTVVPEINFNLRYQVNDWLLFHVGYSALYWSNVARPGALIDTTLNSKLIPTGALLPTNTVPIGAFIPGAEQGRPYFTFHDTAFWAQGITVGVEFRY